MLLHGLTATRRYVVMGSTALERSGHRVIAYDARGHGRSSPAPEPGAYGYDDLGARPRGRARRAGVERAVLAGRLDGRAHAAVARAAAPGAGGGHGRHHARLRPRRRTTTLRAWRAGTRSRTGLRQGGIDGFLAAYGEPRGVPERWRDTVAQGDPPAAVAARASRRARRRAAAPSRARSRSTRSTTSRRSRCPRRGRRQRRRRRPRAPAGDRGGLRGRRSRARGWSPTSPGSSPVAWQGSQLSQLIADGRRARPELR